MTSEVCMMNRRAVVLAADSATTVRYQTAEGVKERYFKGANKIVQLSNHRPIGVMFFDSADILGVPWDVVVKAFRDTLGDQGYPSVRQYAEEFFAFLGADRTMFPDDVRKSAFLAAARIAALQVVLRTEKRPTADEERSAVDLAIAQATESTAALKFAPNTDEPFVAHLISQWRAELEPMLSMWLEDFERVQPSDISALASLGITLTAKAPESYLGTTGLVFAGFGEHDVFPHMVQFTSCGIALDRLIAKEGEQMAIDHSTPAWLSAFAQTSMSDTFLMGFSREVFMEVMSKVGDGLNELADRAAAAAGGDPQRIADKASFVDEARNKIGDAVLEISTAKHAGPLRRVLGSLPVDEMAELAETLVNLQSLKEKVTQPSETVGGPVDVAVITKTEGLVWIKRKHYFDAALNSRYMQRQAAGYK